MTTTNVSGADVGGNDGLLNDIALFMQGYVMIIIMAVGVFGNGLSIVVFYRSRRRNDATIHYLSTLAVSDTCCIVFVGVVLWISTGLNTVTNGKASITLTTYSTLSCKIINYLFVTLQSISAWIIVIFSLERAVVVWFPLKRASITGTKRKGFLALVCLSVSLLCLYAAILSDLQESHGFIHCFFDANLWLVLFITEIFLYYFVPGSIIFTANIFIVVGITVSRKFLAKSMEGGGKESQDRKSLVNLLIVSAMYLVFMTPSTVTWTCYSFANELITPGYAVILVQLGTLFQQWSMLNYCFNFIIYSISLPFYRAELKLLTGILLPRTRYFPTERTGNPINRGSQKGVVFQQK
jgi:hypothetical protein